MIKKNSLKNLFKRFLHVKFIKSHSSNRKETNPSDHSSNVKKKLNFSKVPL